MTELLWLIPCALCLWFGYEMGEWREERRQTKEWWAKRGGPVDE